MTPAEVFAVCLLAHVSFGACMFLLAAVVVDVMS